MASVRIGGDPEQYMDPPSLNVSDKPGGGSFIASILDLLGIHKQVAKGPKESAGGTAQESTTGSTSTSGGGAPTPEQAQPAPAQTVSLPAIDAASQAFQPTLPMPTDWGQRYLDSIKPLQVIDPNEGF